MPLIAALAAVAAVAVSTAAGSHPGHPPTAEDRSATAAYVAADLALQRAATSAAPAQLAAERSLAATIEGECPNVLAHVPSTEGSGHQTSKQFGESIRRQEQLGEIRREVEQALVPPRLPSQTQALAAFISTVRPLRWSEAAITRGVKAFLDLLETESKTEREPLHVCADISAWVASGYTTLTAATKAVSAELLGPAGRLQLSPIVAPGSARLIPFEGRKQRRELIEAARLGSERRDSLAAESEIQTSLERALGFKGDEGEGGFESPRAKGAVLGHGRTAAGGSFTIRAQGATDGGRGCGVEIEYNTGSISGGGGIFFGDGKSRCSITRDAMSPSVDCNEGRLTIEAITPGSVRRVRLRLSDGRTIVSAATAIPASDGGPAGIYYQVVRGPSPIPVSLAELDGHGRAVVTKRLPRIVECTKHPLRFLPGGIRKLVHAHVPGGPAFTIEAQRYRFLGKITLDLKVAVQSEGSGSGSISFGGRRGAHPFFEAPGRSTFRPERQTGCRPAPYAIVYGILKRPADTVLARTSAGLLPLHVERLPASLHTAGVLAWGAFVPPPTELVLRGPGGQELLSESLAEGAGSQIEQCEGEREPSAP